MQSQVKGGEGERGEGVGEVPLSTNMAPNPLFNLSIDPGHLLIAFARTDAGLGSWAAASSNNIGN